MLANIPEKEAPEARRGFDGAQPVDRYPFIFYDLLKKGYVTSYIEDSPRDATFHYRLLGFENPPTVKYTRAFWMRAWEPLKDTHIRCLHQLSLNYTKNFFDTLRDERKFIFIANNIGHKHIQSMALADEDTLDVYRYFKQHGHLQNTAVIMFGDHGPRTSSFRSTLTGKLEERLPFLSITLPSWFAEEYPEHHENLSANTNVLTSHFDVYATLQHLMNLTSTKTNYGLGQSLFTKIDPVKRTCASTGVDSHWCPCLQYTTVDVKDEVVVQITNQIIHQMNKQLCVISETCSKCTPLSVHKITKAGRRTPSEIVQNFKATKGNSVCDSCAIRLNWFKTRLKYFMYEIVFVAAPSGGLFEATALVSLNFRNQIVELRVDQRSISRINLYGSQPDCIAARYPHLRNFCYCK